MIRIALCEDERPQREYLTKMIQEFQREKEEPILLDAYESAEQFMFEREDKGDYDLLILDIQLRKMNGMELAKEVRKENETIQIVFVTGLKEYAIEGFEVGAVRYLVKPIKKELLFDVMDRVCNKIVQQEEHFFLNENGGKVKKISYRKLKYVEAQGHYLSLVGSDGKDCYKASLTSVARELKEHDFVLLRRGLYANIRFINKVGRCECELEDGTILPISKTCYRSVNQQFIQYYRREVP